VVQEKAVCSGFCFVSTIVKSVYFASHFYCLFWILFCNIATKGQGRLGVPGDKGEGAKITLRFKELLGELQILGNTLL